MAIVYDNKNVPHEIDILKYQWSICSEEEFDYDELSYKDLLNNNMVELKIVEWLSDIFPNVDFLYPDSSASLISLLFYFEDDDVLHFAPKAKQIAYPAVDEDGYPYDNIVCLNESEKSFFSNMLCEKIGDKHSPSMQKTMINYHNSVDYDTRNFIEDVISGRDVLPITIGFVSEAMNDEIFQCTGISTKGNRIILTSDAVRHIIARHGPNGRADQSLSDLDDIARASYVIANYDSIEWDGTLSKHYKTKRNEKAPQIAIKKQIDGTYYVIEVASDSKKDRNIVVTMYKKK